MHKITVNTLLELNKCILSPKNIEKIDNICSDNTKEFLSNRRLDCLLLFFHFTYNPMNGVRTHNFSGYRHYRNCIVK
jgi:hypothetical protein